MPQRELDRLRTVNRFLKLQISKEAELQKIVEQAAMICRSPIAMITFMDELQQHVKYRTGTDLTTIAYNRSFCEKAIQKDEPMMVPDASTDPYFSENPFVLNAPHIRFYAGAPLRTSEGNAIGTICVYDTETKELSPIQLRLLKGLSRQVVHLLEFEASLQLLKEQFIAAKGTAITLRSFFESSSSSHLLLDKQMRILAFNKAVDEMTFATQGKRLEEGSSLTDHIHPDFRLDFTLAYNNALKGKTTRLERHLQYNTGRKCWYVTFEPAFDHDQQIMGVSLNAIDITNRVEQEELIKEQRAALRRIKNLKDQDLQTAAIDVIMLTENIKGDRSISHLEETELLLIAMQELNQKAKIKFNLT